MTLVWTPDLLDTLERAVDEGARLQLFRRGTEYVVVPDRIRSEGGHDVLYGRVTGTGDRLAFRLSELERFTVLG